MKKMIVMAIAMIMTIAANANEINTNEFNAIRVNIPTRIRMVKGDTYSVIVQASDSITARSINVSVENGVLKINSRDAEALDNSKLRITIVTPTEMDVTVGRNMEVLSVPRNENRRNEDLALN